jgi:hypothetical protein
MTALFDIFRVETGGVRWLECVTNLDEAKARVRQIAAGAIGEYVVVDQRTGDRIILKFDEKASDGNRSANSTSKAKGN